MIRQAHTYLVGALSGVVVIGIAIAAFVVLVSAQVFHDLPIPALSSSDQKPAVSAAKALGSPDHQDVATTGGTSAGTTQPNHAIANANAAGGGQAGATNAQPQASQGTPAAPARDATAPAEVVETAPNRGGGDTGSTSNGGNSGGSHSPPSSSSHQTSSSPSPGSGGNNATSTSGSSGGGSNGGGTTTSPGSSGGGPATGTSGGRPTAPAPVPSTPVTTAKPSEVVTETVNGTVGTVDEATGGTLGETTVGQATEEAVNGTTGPESVVGKTVDGVGEVVGGLLGGSGH